MAGPVDSLQAAGYSPEEIAAWSQERRGALAAGGFNDDEIDAYFTGGVVAPSKPPKAFVDRINLGQTISRIWGAVAKDAGEAYGDAPLTGFDDKTLDELIKLGIFHDPAKGSPGPIQFTNEAVLMPAAKTIGTVLRGINAGLHGAGALIGELHRGILEYDETKGVDPETEGNRAKREIVNLGNWALIESGFGRFSRPRVSPTGVVDEVVSGLPKSDDFLAASRAVGDGTAPKPMQEKMLRSYEEKGVLPDELAHDAATDPIIAQRLLSKDPKDLPYPTERGDAILNERAPSSAGAAAREAPPVSAAEEQILSKISIGEKDTGRPLSWSKLYTDTVDDLHPLQAVSQNAYELARLTRGQFGKSDYFLNHATFDFNTFKDTGKPLKDILAPVKNDLDGFRAYAVSARALELEERGIKSGFDFEPLPPSTASVAVKAGEPGLRGNWKAENEFGYVSASVDAEAKIVEIHTSTLKADTPHGQGQGTNLYRAIIDKALSEGFTVESSRSVSREARYVYEGLRRKGYTVETINPEGMQGSREPVYRVLRGPSGSSAPPLISSGLEAARTVVVAGRDTFAKPFRELVDYQNRLSQYLRDSGVLSESGYAALVEANQNYVPFFRVMDDGLIKGKGAAGTSLGASNPIKRIKGSDRKVVDPLESVIKNTYAYVSLAERNAASLELIDALKQQGFKAETRAPVKAPAEMVDYLKEQGVTDPAALADFVQHAAPAEGDVIRAFRNGVREEVVVKNDPDLVAAFRGIDRQSVGMLTRIFALPAKGLRAGSTIIPDFIARNLIRDFMTAFVNTKGIIFSPHDTLSGLYSVLRQDASWADWVKGGGANSTMVALDRAYLQESLATLSGETGLMERGWNVVTSPWRGMRMVSELIENATRVGEFKKAVQGPSKAEIQSAAYAAREVTLDFARMGAKMRAYNMVTAFANAQIQGVDRIARAFIDRPVNTSLKVAGGITLPSVLLWWANHDDPRYQELPHWQKDLFWIIPTDKWEPIDAHDAAAKPDYLIRERNGKTEFNNGSIWRIPKPFELGVVFGSGVERVLEATIGSNKEAYDSFSKSVVQAFTPNYIPTAIQPMIEQFANRSTFTDRTLIPADMEKHLPEYQYTPYTTQLSRKLGAVVSDFPGMREAAVSPGAVTGPAARGLTSPILIENYIRSWTGGAGMYALQAADLGLRKAGVLPDPITPTPTLADIPFVKAFAVRYPSAGAQSIQDFYDEHEKQKRFFDTYMARARDGDVAAMEHIEAAGGPMMFSRLDAIKETLSEHSKLVRDIYKNPDMPADEKRQLIDGYYFNMIQIGRFGMAALREMRETAADAVSKRR